MLTPLANLGKHPETGTEILVKDGRFGPYVTDGKTNATINKKIDPLSVTLDQAIEMLVKKAASPKKTFRRRKGA
jgi:DNA topoisomerase-1